MWWALWTGEDVAPGWAGIAGLLYAFVKAGVPDTAIVRMFTEPEHVGAAMVHTRSNGSPRNANDAERMVRGGIRRARNFIATAKAGDKYEAATTAMRVRDAAMATPSRWVGVGGATDLAVLLAMCELAAEAGRYELHADVRTLAERAGVGRATVGRSLARLRAEPRPWIRRVALASGMYAAKYRLMLPVRTDAELGGTFGLSLRGEDMSVPVGSASADVWRWAGLGKAAMRTWAALGDEATTATDIAKALGITDRAIRKHLATLALYGLATKVGHGAWVRGDADPEVVGATMPMVAGRREADRERHQRDRDGRAAYLRDRQRRRLRAEPGGKATAPEATVPMVVDVVVPLPDGSTITVYVPAPAGAEASAEAPAAV